MKEEFGKYCANKKVSVIRFDDDSCEVNVPRSAERISQFLAESPVPTPSQIDIFAGLANLVDKDGLKVVEFENWKLSAEPVGGIPPEGGVLKLTVKF